jgi:hypothetical protein
LQCSSGTRKDTKSIKRLIRKSFTCIAVILVSSCAHQKNNLNPKKVLKSLCLTGIGKGRIEYFQGKQLFSYQSRFNKEKKLWLIGFDLPVIGQEVLRFLYEDKETKGTFANRLNLEIKSITKKNELNNFFDQINKLLTSVDKGSLEKEGWAVKKLKGEDAYLLNSRSTSLKVFSFSNKDKKFHRMTFKYMKKGKKTFVLNLFSNTCTI